MEGRQPGDPGPSDTWRVYNLLQIAIVLQVVLIAGVIWVLLQLGDLPQRTAGLVPFDPGADNTSAIMQLQDSVDRLSTQLDGIEVKLGVPTDAP